MTPHADAIDPLDALKSTDARTRISEVAQRRALAAAQRFDAQRSAKQVPFDTAHSPHADAVELSAEAEESLAHDAHTAHDAHDAHNAHDDLPKAGAQVAAAAAPAASSGESKRRKSVKQAIETGQPVSFSNSKGQAFELAITQPTALEGGYDAYTVTLNGVPLEVRVQGGVNAQNAIASVVNFWSQQPEHLRGDLKTMQIDAGVDPTYNPKTDPFKPKARGGNGTIIFYEGTRYLTKEKFDHEMGHVIGDAVEDRQASPEEIAQEQASGVEAGEWNEQWIPEGYTEAIAADKRKVSNYGNTSPTEDWAEFWRVFMDAQSKGSSAMKSLQKKYPQRFFIAASITMGLDYRQPVA